MKNKHNDQTICHNCAIKPNIGGMKKIAQYSCGDCKKGIDPIHCKECDNVMVYCTKFRYYHDVNPKEKQCWWFSQK